LNDAPFLAGHSTEKETTVSGLIYDWIDKEKKGGKK